MYKQIVPETFDDLAQITAHAARGADTVVMHAGHFLLLQDPAGDGIIPCIASELRDPRHQDIAVRYGRFPELSWSLGLRMLAALDAREKYVMIVVNDWQYVPSGAQRLEFFNEMNRLPDSYARELARYPEIKLLRAGAGDSAGHVFFSEGSLRNRYRKQLKKLIRSGRLPADFVVERDGAVVTARIPGTAMSRQEVYCSDRPTGCAGETAQFLAETSRATGCQTFINLFPRVCWEPVEWGTMLAPRLFATETRTILNIGFESTDVGDEQSLIATSRCALHER